jgi:hypothetical protein
MTDVQGLYTEKLHELPLYGYIVILALFLSLAGNYLLMVWLLGISSNEVINDQEDEWYESDEDEEKLVTESVSSG